MQAIFRDGNAMNHSALESIMIALRRLFALSLVAFFPLAPIGLNAFDNYLNRDSPDGSSQSPTMVAQWASERDSGPELSR